MPTAELEASSQIHLELKKLVQSHRKIKNEPLLLAVQYAPAKGAKDVYLFEIADRFGIDSVDSSRTMFEVSYGNRPDFPLGSDRELRLLLTNPTEWKVAVEKKWPKVNMLRKAIHNKRAKVIFSTPRGARLWRLLSA